jgi:hypothetical protein
VPGQGQALLGQPQPPALPLDEPAARLALELGHLLGDRRRRQVQRLGGGRERAVAGDRVQHPQPDQIEHEDMLTPGGSHN